MKKLQLKIQDLTNPSILTHREIRNIMGGDDTGSGKTVCTIHYVDNDGNKTDVKPDFISATCQQAKDYCQSDCDQNKELWQSKGSCTYSCNC